MISNCYQSLLSNNAILCFCIVTGAELKLDLTDCECEKTDFELAVMLDRLLYFKLTVNVM